MKRIFLTIEKNEIEFKKIVESSNSYADIIKKYNFPDNGKSVSIIRQFIIDKKYNVSHFGKNNKNTKYKTIEKNCPQCNKLFIAKQNHPREKQTCSFRCSNTFFSNKRHTDESKEKVRVTLKKYYKTDEAKNILKTKNFLPFSEKECFFL